MVRCSLRFAWFRYEIKGQDPVTFRLRHNQLALAGICMCIHWHLNKTSVKAFEIRPGKQAWASGIYEIPLAQRKC